MMNIISTILFITMKHIEQHLKNLIDEPNYEIPVNFVLYGDGNPYSSYTSKYKDSPETVRMAEL
ncbi:MAG: hypothetical protein LBQ59_04600, partial [Candidatus Peribacteria bacterium]|nr:hypothetical protein [Candidatus Peribacteria bacterium]